MIKIFSMKKIIFLLILVVILIPKPSYSQQKYTLLEPLPAIGSGSIEKEIDINGYIGYVFKFAIAASAFLAIIMIIYGGFEIMLSEAIPAKLEGKSRVYNALWGLLMVLSSYLILRTIDPRLVQLNADLPPLKINLKPADVDAMQAQLESDITTRVQANTATIKQLRDQKDELSSRMKELELLLYDPNISEQRKDELATEYRRLNSEYDDISVKYSAGVASNSGLNQYRTIVNNIYNRDSNSDSMIKNSTETLDTLYKDALNKASTNEERNLLSSQKEFYKSQINDDETLYNLIKVNGTYMTNIGTQSMQKTDNKPLLEKRLSEYTAELNKLNNGETTLINGTGVDPEVYKNMLNNRISKINKAL